MSEITTRAASFVLIHSKTTDGKDAAACEGAYLVIRVDKLAARQIACVRCNGALLAGRIFVQTQRVQRALVVQPTNIMQFTEANDTLLLAAMIAYSASSSPAWQHHHLYSRYIHQLSTLSYTFYGVSLAGVSCRHGRPLPTTLTLTTLEAQ